jgi:hypothetical protein
MYVRKFNMSPSPQRAPASVMDWEAFRSFADDDIIRTLQSSPEFVSATDRRDQYYHAYVL